MADDPPVLPEHQGWRYLNRITDWVGSLAGLVIAGTFGDSIAHALAGEHTSVTVSLGISVSLSLVGVAAVITVLLRARMTTRTNTYLRRRVGDLERHNEVLRQEVRRLGGDPPAPPPGILPPRR